MATLFVDKLDPQSGTALEIGTSGDTVTVPTGVGLTATDEVKSNKLSPATGTALQIGDSGDTITIPSGATITNNGTQTGFGGANTPFFHAKLGSAQTVSNNTATKVTIDTEVVDTGGCFDPTTNYRFTPTTAGKYFIYGSISSTAWGTSLLNNSEAFIYKNGSNIQKARFVHALHYSYMDTPYVSTIVDMNGSSDYVELWGTTEVQSGTPTIANSNTTYFGGYKLIE